MRRCRVSRAKCWARTQPAATENLMEKTRTHLRNKAPPRIRVSSSFLSLNSCPHFLTPKVPGVSREMLLQVSKSFSGGSVVKNEPAHDTGLASGLGKSPGGGNGNPVQDSCLGNPLDREAWRAIVRGAAKNTT